MTESTVPPAESRSAIAEVIAIGDEMTGGARVDTNSAWIAARLQQLGYEVRYHAMVGDDLGDCIDVFRTAARRSRVAVCTGGLGPTRDDLTREALAAAAGVDLVLDPASLQHIESMFAARGRPMPPRNQNQAMFPRGSSVIFNPQGTAPGVDITLGGETERQSCRVFALPGVPAEMKQMFDRHVVEHLASGDSTTVIATRVMKFFGVGESDMEAMLGDLLARGRQPRVGITVSAATISLRLTAIESSHEACQERLEHCGQEILRRAGEYYFGEGEHYEQHHAVNDIWTGRGEHFGVIEFGHAAPLANWFAGIVDRSLYRGGLHFPSRDALFDATRTHNMPSACIALAATVGVDHFIIVDGYPNLSTTDDKPMVASEVELAVVSGGTVHATTARLGGHPSIVHPRIAKAALAWTRQQMA